METSLPSGRPEQSRLFCTSGVWSKWKGGGHRRLGVGRRAGGDVYLFGLRLRRCALAEFGAPTGRWASCVPVYYCAEMCDKGSPYIFAVSRVCHPSSVQHMLQLCSLLNTPSPEKRRKPREPILRAHVLLTLTLSGVWCANAVVTSIAIACPALMQRLMIG